MTITSLPRDADLSANGYNIHKSGRWLRKLELLARTLHRGI